MQPPIRPNGQAGENPARSIHYPITPELDMTDYREQLAKQVRESLGQHNDNNLPAVECVRDIVAQLERLQKEISARTDTDQVYKYVLVLRFRAAWNDGYGIEEIEVLGKSEPELKLVVALIRDPSLFEWSITSK